MGKIARLPLHVANQIAAGEVIERPASVVKEVVENALDAGARRITIDVGEGGRSLRITDDGEGMSEEDAVLAFERFATSKIQTSDELWQLTTMGFRGEALASIASVAKVDCLTRQRGAERGTAVSIQGGAVPVVKPVGCPEGTTLIVSDLFYNLPVRLKFLRAAATEQGHIVDVTQGLALSNPEVDFKLVINGREILSTVGARTLPDVAASLLGDDLADGLIAIDHTARTGRVWGLISRPDQGRTDRSRQWFFINQRWVRHPLLAKAVEEAYVGHLAGDRHPVFLLFLDLDRGLVDVNVHPAKREVRLGQTQRVFLMIKDALMEGLGPRRHEACLPALAAESTGAYGPWPDTTIEDTASAARPHPGLPRELSGLRVIAQLHSTYILAEHPDGLFLIDQCRAHKRWLYEQLAAAQVATYPLSVPMLLPLSPAEAAIAAAELPALLRLGFAFEPFDEANWIVRVLPLLLPEAAAKPTLRALVSRTQPAGEDGLRRVVAEHAAMKRGEVLDLPRMVLLVERLQQCHQPLVCPAGHPTGIMISLAELGRRFLKTDQ